MIYLTCINSIGSILCRTVISLQLDFLQAIIRITLIGAPTKLTGDKKTYCIITCFLFYYISHSSQEIDLGAIGICPCFGS